jgi:hypothetical protein
MSSRGPLFAVRSWLRSVCVFVCVCVCVCVCVFLRTQCERLPLVSGAFKCLLIVVTVTRSGFLLVHHRQDSDVALISLCDGLGWISNSYLVVLSPSSLGAHASNSCFSVSSSYEAARWDWAGESHRPFSISAMHDTRLHVWELHGIVEISLLSDYGSLQSWS